MIRKFLECRNYEERFEYFAHTFDFQWSDSEMNILFDILGIEKPGDETTHEEKYVLLFHALKEKKAA